MRWVSRVVASWRAARQVTQGSRWPVHEVAGMGRRALAWQPGNPGAVAALFTSGHDLRVKSRDLVRRNAWAGNAVDSLSVIRWAVQSLRSRSPIGSEESPMAKTKRIPQRSGK